MKKKLSLLVVLVFVGTSVFAWNDPSKSRPNNNQSNGQSGNRANCVPAKSSTQLELNNIRALIETGGNMWQDRSGNGTAAYEAPKDAGTTVMYAGSLWLGGKDVNGQLKIAAVQFRSDGDDYWPGPLSEDFAEIDAITCANYDKFWEITRQEVLTFNAWFECVNDINGPCDEAELFPGYQVPTVIQEWPAHGDQTLGQSEFLAPFYDRDQNGLYEWSKGDYPWYDILGEAECGNDRTVRLFGDQTYWWVFNDKGNIHTETGGESIGMEIRAQAFAFATSDEVNNMTFYNYELVNQSTQTLTDTYFGQWADSDVGCSEDDYVGCDVQRGLGYAYNADGLDNDGCNGAQPYGANPPAVGIDFFEGPYQDDDNIDNPGPNENNGYFISYNDAIAGNGITYKGMGIGYGDDVVDNERFGMRKFVFYDRLRNFPQTDPNNAVEHYRYLSGFWQDGQAFVYGGFAYPGTAGAIDNLPCDYCYPGDSDPLGFGVGGVGGLFDWSEPTNNNVKGDRRFMQSAGPFTLEPGAVNNITVGVVYARAAGGIFASVEAVRLADDKAQALFDNCFEIIEGPDAPDMVIQELDKELILYISNPTTSNNYNEEYEQIDPFIPVPDSIVAQGGPVLYNYNRYRFEGYQIYQLKNKDVSVSELNDNDVARLVAQCDVKNGVTQLVNWTLDESIGVPEPFEMVNGEDDGIKHSFRITQDLFGTTGSQLVNHKKYYYMAIAYGYNSFKEYDITDPTLLDGQDVPYLPSRKSGLGGEIRPYEGIPHIPAPEANGTIIQAEYGDIPEITRLEGAGNGGLVLEMSAQTEKELLTNSKPANPVYARNGGPISVTVVDPLNVPTGTFKLIFNRDKSFNFSSDSTVDKSTWTLIRYDSDPNVPNDTIESDKAINLENDQVIPEWGLAVNIRQVRYTNNSSYTEFLEADLVYADSSKQWLGGVPDVDGSFPQNWIRAGASSTPSPTTDANGCGTDFYDDYVGDDDDEIYEGILGGTVAPYRLCGVQRLGTSNYPCVPHMPIASAYSQTRTMRKIKDVNSVDIVITSDQSKWTRCLVVEMNDDPTLGPGKQELRTAPSVDKNGNPDASGTNGMGWFPGYAIDLETGERLNMAFGEDSDLAFDNGADMKWNPTSRMYSNLGRVIWGGMHYVYIFADEAREGPDRMPPYDEGAWAYSQFASGSSSGKVKVWRSTRWVALPMLNEGETFMSSDVRIRLRVAKRYELYATAGVLSDSVALSENNWVPMYEFSTDDIAVIPNSTDTALSALDLINVVPNPYYARSGYEENRLDSRVKFTNLPEQCTISIYTSHGVLVRQFTKDDPLTSFDWDLKNQKGIPIASGAYIIHIKADNLPDSDGNGKKANERVLKWFGVIRPPDLDNF